MNYLALAEKIVAEIEHNTEHAPPPVDAGPYGAGRCFKCGLVLPSGDEIALCGRCRNRGLGGGARSSLPVPPYPLHIEIDDERIVLATPGAEADLVILRRVVEDYSWCWHDDSQVRLATELGERIEELMSRLNAQGEVVRVVKAS